MVPKTGKSAQDRFLKKGQKTISEIYRGITLLNSTLKVLEEFNK